MHAGYRVFILRRLSEKSLEKVLMVNARTAVLHAQLRNISGGRLEPSDNEIRRPAKESGFVFNGHGFKKFLCIHIPPH
jgi:hypothetical protein